MVLTALLSFISLAASLPPINDRLHPRQRDLHYDYTFLHSNQHDRADAVVEMFRFAWNGYYAYAYPHDDYLPKTNGSSDSMNGWGLLMFDALDTAIIMEQQDIVDIILEHASTVDFTKNNAKPPNPTYTSLFQTNIRYLGGMLSSYDLLKGPFAHMANNETRVNALLTQAQSLADALKFAFDTPTGIPIDGFFIDNSTFTNATRLADGTNWAGLAAFGTLCLEWQQLSDLTGNPEYGALAGKAESNWFSASQIWPGLTGGNFSVATGQVLDGYGGWNGGNDSAYEYLIKMHVYDPDRYHQYGKRWRDAADSTIKHLLSHPSTRPDLTMAAAFNGRQLQNLSEEYTCFIGGNFILGGTLFNRSDYIETGLDFCEFCANGYRYASSGIGPNTYSWNTSVLAEPANNKSHTAQYNQAGWFIPGQNFGGGQVPEAVESWYYAWQVTGDQYWRDVAWAYTLAQNRTERVESGRPGVGGWSDVMNVLASDGGGTGNFMESFMLAEVLKYQYLIQTPKAGWVNVEHGSDNRNRFVFNTEGHPLRVAARHPV